MTTIASPRPSLTISSRRTSASTVDTNVRPDQTSQAGGAPNPRRNRAALREFYGLKNVADVDVASSSDTLPADDSTSPRGEIDRPGFDTQRYVEEVLEREGLEGVMRVEAGLLRDIRGFDGERKALVYDNYSKLIGATETIRKMRGNMDPLKPAFTTLTPAISHIADRSKVLSSAQGNAVATYGGDSSDGRADEHRRTVQYVLDAPNRLQKLVDQNHLDLARTEWTKVSRVLERWDKVAGVAEVRQQCASIMDRIVDPER